MGKTSRHHKPALGRRISRSLHILHRRIGAMAFLFIFWMVITGWLLNHADSLALEHTRLSNTWLTQWYGLDVDIPSTGFFSEHHWISNTSDEQIIFDGKLLEDRHFHAIGLAQQGDIVAIASTDHVLLLDETGQVIEMLGLIDLPLDKIISVGKGCNGIAITDGNVTYSTTEGITWSSCTNTTDWSEAHPLDSMQKSTLQKLLSPSISMEKLIIDLHSGRFFGKVGPCVVDIVGLVLLLLASSGLWMFFRQTRLQHRRSRN